MRIARWAFTVFLIAPLIAPLTTATVALAQQQDDSIAAVARRAQQQKKDQTKAAKVWDNDNMPSKPGAVNVVGQESSADTSAATATGAGNPPADQKAAIAPEEKAALDGDLASAKSKLADLKADLDVMQRKYSLDQQTYYGKTNYAADKAGAAALASEKSDIDAKQDAIAAAEKLLADLQSKVDAANSAASQDKSSQDKSSQDKSNQSASTQSTSTPSTSSPDNPAPATPARPESSNPN